MPLTEEQKRKIEEEESYRAKVRDESPTIKKGRSGCLIIFLLFLAFIAVIFIAVNPAKQIEEAEKSSLSVVTPFPATDVVGKTEDEIKTTYATLYTNYSETGLTPSGNVKITGFDIENANIQIDYDVTTNKPVYVGYSFSANPLIEEKAWKITSVNKPIASPVENPGIMNRTVHLWENIEEIEPYKTIIAIYEPDGNVSAISFSMEDIATSKSNRSLYYVP